MAVFEVLVIEKPREKDTEDLEKILFGPKLVVAKSSESAGMQVILGNDLKKNINPERIKVIIRPFSQPA